MAGAEFFREEIVIDINENDFTNKLKKVESRLNNFFDKAKSQSNALDRATATPTVAIRDNFSLKAKAISTMLGNFTRKSWDITIKAKDMASGVFNKLTSPLGMLGMGLTIAAPAIFLGDSIKKAMDFEAQLSSIKALTGATVEEMTQMKQLSLQMGAATKYSALEAAQGIEELLKAGLTPAQVKAGGLEAALNLATAGGLGLAESAEIMSTSLNAYKADALKASEAADILAGTANASATGVSDLRQSLAMVSAVASGVGVTFRDTNIALGLFANNGLKGSDAGTSLKTMLMNLQPSTDKQMETFKKLGVVTGDGANQFYTATGKLKSLKEISGIMTEAFKDLTDQQRMMAMEIMFGSDAIRAANILYKEGAKGVEAFDKAMGNVTALDVAKEKMNNAAGELEQFSGALETMQISALMPTMPLIRKLAVAFTDFTISITPAMTAAGERFTKFFDDISKDENFQKLGLGDKIIFVLERMVESFSRWMDGPGGEKLVTIMGKVGELLSKALNGLIPVIVPAALILGKAIGEGILAGLVGALKSSPIGAMIAGGAAGAVIGSVVPGLGTVAGAAIGALSGDLTYHLVGTEPPKAIQTDNWGGANPSMNPTGGIQRAELPNPTTDEILKSWGVQKKASGGFVYGPQVNMVGEEGAEVVIPLSRSRRNRGLELWSQAGQMLGVKGYANGGFAGIAGVTQEKPGLVIPFPVSGPDRGLELGYKSEQMRSSEQYFDNSPVESPARPVREKGGTPKVDVNVDQIIVQSDMDEDEMALKIGRIIVQKYRQAVENTA